MQLACVGNRFKTVDQALGRHKDDPSIKKPDDILGYQYTLWNGQFMNLLAMALLKYSICSYLLLLKFSTLYNCIVWASILMVTVFNFILPTIGHFDCTPLAKNYNKKIEGKCFVHYPEGITYMQGVSNCVTDVVYVVAPLIYLRTVQLPRRTQWGLRAVFMLGLV